MAQKAAEKETKNVVSLNPFIEEGIDNEELSRKFVYVLVQKNEELNNIFEGRTNRQLRTPQYKPFQNLLTTCFINWDGSDGKPRGKRMLRYYDGCSTLFADEQPQDKDLINQLLERTQARVFGNGYLEVYGYERMLKKYMDMASYNSESKYRTHTAPSIFVLLDREKELLLQDELTDQMELALQRAKEASVSKMRIHSKYLEIPDFDIHSMAKLSDKALRAEYRSYAMKEPQKFNESYGDNSIETKYWIKEALKNGQISTNALPNKAVWGDSKVQICEIGGLKSTEAITEKIYEETQFADGEEFVLQLKALFK